MTVGQPIAEVEVLSARGSTRHWSEASHSTFTVAAISRARVPVGVDWRTRGRTLATAGGQLMNINAGDGHHTVRVHAPSAFDAVKLTPVWLETAARELGARLPFRFASPSSESACAFDAIGRLVRRLAENAAPFELEVACQELARALVSDLAETPTSLRGRSNWVRDFRLRRVREYLEDHLCERPSLVALEEETGLGKSQLCALFKNAYGTSMGEYWMGCRVAHAKMLLLQGARPVCVAADLGFTDEAYFSRMFRRYHGLSPSAWATLYHRNSHPSVCHGGASHARTPAKRGP